MISESSISAGGGTSRTSKVLKSAFPTSRLKVPSGVGHYQLPCLEVASVSSERQSFQTRLRLRGLPTSENPTLTSASPGGRTSAIGVMAGMLILANPLFPDS